MCKRMKKSGFSLIELSISVTIIAIIISLIVSAKGIVEDSKLKTIVADFAYYQSAFNKFNSVYKGFPGDLPNATDYWTSTCATIISCNGDGNGVIDYSYGSANASELERAWKHLDLADLIKDGFPVTTQNRAGLEVESSAPRSVFKLSGYSMIGGVNIGGVTGGFITSPFSSNINAIYIGLSSGGYNRPLDVGALTAEQAYSIDAKFDDAKIDAGNAIGNSTGKIRSVAGYGSAANTCISGGYYNIAESSLQSCVVGYQLNE